MEQMDKYYGNVCELDIIFNFQKAYFILDELLIAGEMQETSKKNVLRCISQQDSLEDMEVSPMTSPLSLSSKSWHSSMLMETRLRKMWSPRSCNQRAGLQVYIVLINATYSFQDSDDVSRNLERVGL